MKRKKKISFVIPIYNEEDVLPHLTKTVTRFINSIPQYNFEILCVENGSSDKSFKLLTKTATKDKRFKVVQLARNVGCDGGISAGMQYARGDALVILMADLQEPIELVNTFLTHWEHGYDIVYGVVRKRTAGMVRNTFSVLFYKLLNALTHNMFPENASDFRLIDKKVYKAVNAMQEQNKYLRGLIAWTGYKQKGVLFDRRSRLAGRSKADFFTVLQVALNGIFSFSTVPLRITSLLGVALTAISFLLMTLYVVVFFVKGREAPGVMTLIALLLFLFGMLFFILGIISEYLLRIYDEVKKRPHFLIRTTINIRT